MKDKKRFKKKQLKDNFSIFPLPGSDGAAPEC